MSDRPTPDDYTVQDGLDTGLIDRCPHCERSFHPSIFDGVLVDTDGTEYDHLTATDPGDRPFFCGECWDELQANVRAEKNHAVTEWSG